MKICEVHHLGLIDYQLAWDLQNQYAAEIASGQRPATLLFLEHPHTFTFGRRGQIANLLWGEDELARRGVTVHWVDRGGDVTYHGPGQLVGYPLIPLEKLSSSGDHIPQADYVGYIRKLEQMVITAVANFGVEARQMEGLTGVWVDHESTGVTHQSATIAKLAAIGVKVDAHGVTRHGFAINLNPDMSFWEGIIGCGLEYPEISLAQLVNPTPTMESVREAVAQSFGQTFNYLIINKEIKTNEKT